MGLDVTLSDYVAAKELAVPPVGGKRRGKVPDFVGIIREGSDKGIIILGEAKVPGEKMPPEKPNAQFDLNHFLNLTFEVDSRRERWLGQIGKNLKHQGLQFGFLTTYNHTIFLRLVQHGKEGRDDDYELYYSRPVGYYEISTDSEVSVREGYYALLNMGRDDRDLPRPQEIKTKSEGICGEDEKQRAGQRKDEREVRESMKRHRHPK